MKRATFSGMAVCLAVLPMVGGCKGLDLGWWSWFDPTQSIRRPEQSMVLPIFPEFGPVDQTQAMVPNATFPTAEDLEVSREDYLIGPSDLIRVTVMDLFQDGLATPMERQVSHSGYVTLLLLPQPIKVAGLTEEQIAELVTDLYRKANILKDPSVSVVVLEPRQNTFSINGAVQRPGTYGLPRAKFTLLDVLALAGGVTQVHIEYAYVYRPGRPARPAPPAGAAPAPAGVTPAPPPAGVTPAPATQPGSTEDQLKQLEKLIPGAMRKASGPGEGEKVLLSSVGGPTGPAPTAPAEEDVKDAGVTYKRMYTADGQVVLVPVAGTTTQPATARMPQEADQAARADPFGWGQQELTGGARIIAVNLSKLEALEPRWNVVIRPGDIVQVPNLEVGEFYVMGEVLRPGAYSLTGRRITVKMALSAAGNLGALAWPNNSILIRRVGADQEQIVPLPLQDIVAGREPDVFLKPNDVIAVGSYWAAPFIAVWRNAFRMTYGFGFIYDRNYSEREFEIPILWPRGGYRDLYR